MGSTTRYIMMVAVVAVVAASSVRPAAGVMPTVAVMSEWATTFSSHLNGLSKNDLGIERIQNAYENNMTWVNTTRNATKIFLDLQRGFEDKIRTRSAALVALKKEVELGFANGGGSSSSTACCQVSPALEFNPLFKAAVDTSMSCTSVPSASVTGTSSAKASDGLDAVMSNNRQAVRSIKWQYFGSEDGFFRIYPAAKTAQCYDYDPRFRPWFVQAATPTPKDIVVVIDSSGSMGSTRMSKAKAAAQIVLSTLNPDDYFNVVDFDSSARSLQVPACFQSGLAKATSQNQESLSDYVSADVASGGSTYYHRALSLAYDMLSTAQNQENTSGGNRAILFLTDGEPTDSESSITSLIQSKPSDIYLMTFGLGDGLGSSALAFLQEMADAAGKGTFLHIPDSGDLRTAMGKYYDEFSTPAQPQPVVWTPPYFDASGLGLVVTAALPVYQGSDLKGVVGVDLTVDDLVAQASYFSVGEYSFSFVIDDTGRVIMHPLLPPPTGAPVYLDISRLEPGSEFQVNVRSPMVLGKTGSYDITLTRARSRGNSLTEGVVTSEIRYTIWYGPVNGSNLRVAVAFAHPDQFVETISATSHVDVDKASEYHRIDLTTGETECKHVGQPAIKATSTFKLAPDVFSRPAEYLGLTETTSDANAWAQWVKTGTTPPLDLLHPTELRQDVIASSAITPFWVETATSGDVMAYTAWRYIGTQRGVFRMFPGTASSTGYNPKERPWYARAMSLKGMNAISTPYQDASGAGQIVTMSHVIYSGLGPFDREDPVVGVAGVDFTLGKFWAFIVDNSGCSDTLKDSTGRKVTCFVMDESGFIVMHPAFLDGTVPADKQDAYFVGEMYPRLAAKLVDPTGDAVLTQSRCNAFESIESRLFYTSNTRKVDGLTGVVGNGCTAEYALSPVPNTNTYLVSVSEDTCLKAQSSCTCNQNLYTLPADTCQCPGPSRLTYNTCTGQFSGTELADPTCPPPPVPRDIAAAPVSSSVVGLSACYAVNCEDQSMFLDCYGLVGCDWCQFDNDGDELPPADWFCQQGTCPISNEGGVAGNGAGVRTPVLSLMLAVAACIVCALL